MIAAHRHIVSLLPVYFDRIYSFASPLYGFDTSELWSDMSVGFALTSWDEQVISFLRQNDKADCTAAMCLVLETAGADARIERGYQLKTGQETKTKADEISNSSAKYWQAMYLRNTTRLVQQSNVTSSPHVSGTWSSHNSVRSSLRGSHLSNLTSAVNSPALPVSRKKRTPNVKHSPSFLNRKSTAISTSDSSVLEYAPEAGAVTSWPHSIWERLSSLLNDEKVKNTAAETLLDGKASVLPAVRVYHVDEKLDQVKEEDKPEFKNTQTSLFNFRWNEAHVKSKCG